MRKEFQMETGVKLADGVCFRNRGAGPGGCIAPSPQMLPQVSNVWALFEAARDSVFRNAMDNRPINPAWSDVEAVARALGISWDEDTLNGYRELFAGFLDSLPPSKKN